ncbi:MAG TPA: AMP-binding protein [Hyphomicrobiales bacterium]|jgi:2-furoate---CoA ligase
MFDVGTTLIAAAAREPCRLALVDGDLRLSYRALLEKSLRLASGLAEIGIKHGDHLLVLLQNRAEMAILHWATQISGIIVTPINWRAKSDEIDFFLQNSQSRAIVFETASASAVQGAQAAKTVPRIAVGGASGGTHDFAMLLGAPAAEARSKASAEDWSLMFYTSGTTGQGKGVPRRHRAERAAAIAHVAQNAYLYGEITLGVMPLYHTMGVRSLLAMAAINGTFVCLPRFDAGKALELIERERITNLYLVPTLYHDLLSHPHFGWADTSSVTKLGFAGASMTDGLMLKLQAAFEPTLFVNHYGSSEIYTFTIDQRAARKPGSAGRAGINTQVRVVRIGGRDPGAVMRTGEEGEIIAILSGDESFEGYWRRPDADAKALVDGWYFTGDIGYRDKDGDLFVTGRVDDMMITGGENVLPAEIESVLSLHPAVAEVAVVGLPDDRWGHKVTAFIKRSQPVTEDELDSHCRASGLTNFKRPKAYRFVEAVPKSPVGKILRRLLVNGQYQPENRVPQRPNSLEPAS